MNRYISDKRFRSLLPSGEIKEKKSIADDQILKKKKAV